MSFQPTIAVELGAFADGRFVDGEEARRTIASWGFDHDETDLRRFRDLLQELVAITRRARRTPAQKRTVKMDEMTTTNAFAAESIAEAALSKDRPVGQAIRRMASGRGGSGDAEFVGGAAHGAIAAAEERIAKRELSDAECDVLTDIFELAEAHSYECLEKGRALRDAIAASPQPWDWTDFFNEYTYAVAHVHTTITRAAVARVAILAPLDQSVGNLLDLKGGQLERFLRPIFDEAGIGDSFVGSSDPGSEDRTVDDVTEFELLRQAMQIHQPNETSSRARVKLGGLGFTAFENAFQRAGRVAAGRPPRSLHELELARLSIDELNRLWDRGIEEADEEAQRRGLVRDGQKFAEPAATDESKEILDVGDRARLTAILMGAREALRAGGSQPSDDQVMALERALIEARPIASQVPAYSIRIEAALRCARQLRGSPIPLEAIGEAHTAIATILQNLEL
jgi:hypothetical protein